VAAAEALVGSAAYMLCSLLIMCSSAESTCLPAASTYSSDASTDASTLLCPIAASESCSSLLRHLLLPSPTANLRR
jgi:hypothetical protein